MYSFLKKWGKIVAGNKSRFATLVVWILVIGILSSIWPQVNQEETASNNLLPEDAMSVEAEKIMQKQFPNDSGIPLLLVWYRDGGLTDDDYQSVQAAYQQLKKDPLEYQSLVPDFGNMPVEALKQPASQDLEALTTPVFFEEDATTEELQQAMETLKNTINDLTAENSFDTDIGEDGLHVRFTGPVGIQTDAVELFSQADVTLLIATVILVLVLLIVLYRSPILAVVPLISVGFAYGLISPLLGFMANQGWIEVDAQAISIMTVLLFGAGTDYCLFLISRYRDELQLETNKYTALHKAISHSGGAIMMSCLTTVIGLFTLSLAQYASYDRFAVPFSLAILIMGVAVLAFLPAILSMLGRIAFFPFIPRTEKMAQELEEKKGKPVRHPKTRSRFSKSVGRLVTEKPWRIIAICTIFLGALALVVPKISLTYGLLDSFPKDMPSREGFTIIAEHYPPGTIAPVQIIVDTEGKDVSLQDQLASMDITESVSEPRTGEENQDYQAYELTLAMDPYSRDAIDRIPAIKNTVAKGLKDTGIENAGDHVWIGGETATLYDTEEITKQDQNLIIPVVLIIIAALLLAYLRSIIAMIYLLLTVVLSYLSALGLGWLVIHYGFDAPAMQGLIPLYAFVFLVALGEDYNIFMVSNIWKNRKHMPMKEAIAEGVGQTSGVISSAGLILAGTFSVLAVLPMQVLVQFGTVTAIGVLLDTFIVRPLLVPSITTVLGRFAFWPGKLWRKK
ncbi:MMPL family transporter [Virgibacillus oceani]|uniref:Membrane protein n=1 Tax=Virgibacillus oceani TaxID=1479511 RepID=A0A917M2Z5_9BACI|nr:MMPL family transporter [Virgibacillus oceani]GGG75915.1 membrane protein [Virgibacillus oceani]